MKTRDRWLQDARPLNPDGVLRWVPETEREAVLLATIESLYETFRTIEARGGESPIRYHLRHRDADSIVEEIFP